MNKLTEVVKEENKENNENFRGKNLKFEKNSMKIAIFSDFPSKIGRRGTQAVVFKSSPIQAPPPVPLETKLNVRLEFSHFSTETASFSAQ